MNDIDVREFEPDSHTLIHRLLNKIRECEKYNIDVDSYLDKREFIVSIEILNCCLNHKDSKYISRRE